MAKYTVKNWREYQHYKDRNPPWIKLHIALLSSEDWVLWDDASRVLATCIMLLAPRSNGVIDDSPRGRLFLRRVGYLNQEPDLKPLIDSGFLVPFDHASNTLAGRLQDACSETETETEAEAEKIDDVDARAPEDFAVPQSGLVAGIPSCILPIASIDNPTDKQRAELTYLAETTGVSLDDMLARLPHATWTKASARLAIDKYRAIQAKAARPKTFDQIKRDNSDDAIATVMREISRASD